MNSNSQASLEYLMTYGWAFVIIVTIAGVLFFLMSPPAPSTSCSSFEHILVKGAKADTEKIVFKIANGTGTTIDGFHVYGADPVWVYTETESPSPPLFGIDPGKATVGNTTNSTCTPTISCLSNDYVINFIEGYKNQLGSGIEKEIIIPWPINGFAGTEFGNEPEKEGCNFFTNSIGKKFTVTITAYYRNGFGYAKKETANCTGTIEQATEVFFPPSAWGC